MKIPPPEEVGGKGDRIGLTWRTIAKWKRSKSRFHLGFPPKIPVKDEFLNRWFVARSRAGVVLFY